MCMFCRSLLVLLSFYFWPLCCLSFFDLRFLITPLVSSNSSEDKRLLFVLLIFVELPTITVLTFFKKNNK